MLRVVHVDPDHADARRLVAQLDAALAAITGESGAASFDPQDCRGAGACFVLAYDAMAAQSAAAPCARLRAISGNSNGCMRGLAVGPARTCWQNSSGTPQHAATASYGYRRGA